MHWSDTNTTDVVYTMVEEGTFKTMHYNVTTLRADPQVQALPIQRVAFNDSVKYMLEHSGIEPHRLANKRKLISGQNSAAIKASPSLVCTTDVNGRIDAVIVDGNHLAAAFLVEGYNSFPAKLIPEAIWSEHVITGLPAIQTPEEAKSLVEGWSGMDALGRDAMPEHMHVAFAEKQAVYKAGKEKEQG
jgi:hypothetical protein